MAGKAGRRANHEGNVRLRADGYVHVCRRRLTGSLPPPQDVATDL